MGAMTVLFRESEFRRQFGLDKEFTQEGGRGTVFRGPDRREKADACIARRKAARHRAKERKLAVAERSREAASLGQERFERRKYEHAKVVFLVHAARWKACADAGQAVDPIDRQIVQRNLKEMMEYENANRT
jgi:hypothetical protein